MLPTTAKVLWCGIFLNWGVIGFYGKFLAFLLTYLILVASHRGCFVLYENHNQIMSRIMARTLGTADNMISHDLWQILYEILEARTKNLLSVNTK